MVGADSVGGAGEEVGRGHEVRAAGGVVVALAGERLAAAELADVVQHGSEVEVDELALRQFERPPQGEGVGRDALAVTELREGLRLHGLHEGARELHQAQLGVPQFGVAADGGAQDRSPGGGPLDVGIRERSGVVPQEQQRAVVVELAADRHHEADLGVAQAEVAERSTDLGRVGGEQLLDHVGDRAGPGVSPRAVHRGNGPQPGAVADLGLECVAFVAPCDGHAAHLARVVRAELVERGERAVGRFAPAEDALDRPHGIARSCRIRTEESS